MRILVTNADYANALAAVRSLGGHGLEVLCGSERRRAQSFYSRYCVKRLIYPAPAKEAEFVRSMTAFANSEKLDVILPIGYNENVVISKHASELSGTVKLPIAPWESMRIASDKALTMQLAGRVGVGIPRVFSSPDEVDSFPVVVKGVGGSGNVSYVNSKEDLAATSTEGAVIQEYVPGDGYGFFALFNRGALRAVFMHRRLREFPVTGGASTAAESIFDPELKAEGLKLLSALNWHGVAMAEFKKDSRDGKFKLMEINPKFWGSLDLSIASGVDFPYLAVKMAVDGDVEPVMDYEKGVRFRWLLPYDVMHVLAKPASAKEFVSDFCNPKTISNIWPRDLGPNVFQAAMTVGSVGTRLVRGTLKHPHGIPREAP